MCDPAPASGSENDKFADMDELLCEYVDGIMDPCVRRVFEEYMRSDREFAAHVDELQRTRAMLCRYRCQIHAPLNFSGRLHKELTHEMMVAQAPVFTGASQSLRHAASFSSLMVAMLLVGLAAGSLVADEVDLSTTRTTVDATESLFRSAPGYRLDGPAVAPMIGQSSFGSFPFIGPAQTATGSSLMHADTHSVEFAVDHP